ncbi:MAG TPA: phosphoribosylamine--glycine ligase [Gemmatimonadales bacterium]|jgi:phosphoribosylamine--glycine ligase
MRILIVGGGGREHALAAALAGDDPSHLLYVAPGNPGTAALATNLAIAADDIDRLSDACDAYAIDLTVIGPELPLALGLADRLRSEGRTVFGPGAAGAQIESSKAYAKEVMDAAGVPTAGSRAFADLAGALDWITHHDEPLVVKASGLAAGKGAVVCTTRAEARAAVRAMLGDRSLGEAGSVVVIEEFLLGEELSILAVSNGHEVVILPAAQDHKRLLDGDRGPNTGGMGAYAPVSIATPALLDRIEREVLLPTLGELQRRSGPYRGVLFAGIMVHPDGTPNVVEFNCRLGDPETQVVLPLLDSGLTALLDAAARGESMPSPRVRDASAVTTIVASAGYPDAPVKGDVIHLPAHFPPGVELYHAGTTRRTDGALITNGGRVFAVTAVARSFAAARQASQIGAAAIEFEGRQSRTDIGWRELARQAPH